jgi:hypothetical protein
MCTQNKNFIDSEAIYIPPRKKLLINLTCLIIKYKIPCYFKGDKTCILKLVKYSKFSWNCSYKGALSVWSKRGRPLGC